jgi:hypothetical protein
MNYSDYLKLNIPEEFGCNTYMDLPNEDLIFNQLPYNVITLWGATQFVIIDPDLTDVIKIPFNGTYDNWDNDKECYQTFRNFENDYTKRTEKIYKDAEGAGLSDIFLEQKFLGLSANNIPIFRQEYVYPCEDGQPPSGTNPTKESKELVKKNINKYVSGNSELEYNYWSMFEKDWTAAAIDWYDYEYIEKLFNFLNQRDLFDFHSGNYGYRANGEPVIFDYCDYLD